MLDEKKLKTRKLDLVKRYNFHIKIASKLYVWLFVIANMLNVQKLWAFYVGPTCYYFILH